MEDQLHPAGSEARESRFHKNLRRRAGMPPKRFFKRFVGMSSVPDEDLEALSEGLRRAMDADPESRIPALQALVRREIRAREGADSD